ncbi:MAG: ABC transporter ATP-binding protein [Puniceicoccales bacterium]|jgi:ABC-2 type transport system ATP-binding protein|nr:ABC transporter ATP-binding protein [Puniceicoccales bacterium]
MPPPPPASPASESAPPADGSGALGETEAPPPALSVENLVKRYAGVTAVEDVSFSVGRGEIVGFLGPNGAGKSTTMRIVAGVLPATSGIARVGGISVAADPERACRRLGYMPENNPLPDDLRVTEYLRWRALLKGASGRGADAAVTEAMEACDLVRKARRRLIGTLSKGFRQRVGIADALLCKPDVVILDEPTIGLDPHQILGIRRLIRGLRGKMSVLISSHILPEIEQVCDRVIIINQGRVVASGTAEALRREFIPNTRFEIEADTTQGALETLLLPEEPRVEVSAKGGGRFSVTLPAHSPLAPALLGKIWNATGGAVRNCHAVEPTLEDIFIAATRRGWEMETRIAPAAP